MKDSGIGKLKTENGKLKDRVVIGVGCDCCQQCLNPNRHCEQSLDCVAIQKIPPFVKGEAAKQQGDFNKTENISNIQKSPCHANSVTSLFKKEGKNRPMKDSGIAWIGNSVNHWEYIRGKYVFEQKTDRGNSKNLVLLSPTQNYGVIPQDLYEKLSGFSAVKLNEKTDYNLLKTVHKGAFVISLRSFQGGFEYSEYEGVVSPAYQVFYPIIPVCDGYYKYLFKTQVFIDKMNSYTMSLRDGKNIAFADFGRTYIPIPPKDEQEKIANYLDDKCKEIDDIIDHKKEQISVLANYKKSLIYEYVTGKKTL